MESTLHDLGQLLLKAIPTLFLLLVVHFYLKRMFFRPMADVLAKRRAATEGQRESAEAMRAKAGEQTKAIEDQLRQAREAMYQEQEEALLLLGWARAGRLLDEVGHRRVARHLPAQERAQPFHLVRAEPLQVRRRFVHFQIEIPVEVVAINSVMPARFCCFEFTFADRQLHRPWTRRWNEKFPACPWPEAIRSRTI